MMPDPANPQAAADADQADPLAKFRASFLIPTHRDQASRYFCGNSLGLQPRRVASDIQAELADWATLAVDGHFKGQRPWLDYHRQFSAPLATLVGAYPDEVVAMNSLSINLHMLMVSFYRPSASRYAILIEAGAFPSDRYAVESQLRYHGLDPATALIELQPDLAHGCVSESAIEAAIREHGSRLALVLLPGVQYRTGQAYPISKVSQWAHAVGSLVGFDLAHAVGNLELQLHASDVDFAVWCSYKYLNAGPGAIAGAFVHRRQADTDRPRFAGWWGHQQASRFAMGDHFIATPGAEGWQVSNPPILAMTPLLSSLQLFQQASMPALRRKSLNLTAYLHALLAQHVAASIEVISPDQPSQRGAQLSLRVRGGREQGRKLFAYLADHGIIGDWREPDVIRLAPVPLYNRFQDCWDAVQAIRRWQDQQI